METMKPANEILNAKEGPKVNLPFKCKPSVSDRLKQEAVSRNIALSPYLEGLVTNYNIIERELTKARAELAEFKRKNAMLETEIASEKMKYRTIQNYTVLNSSRQKNELDELKKQLETMKMENSIYTDKYLLQLFESVKGKKDKVQLGDGETIPVTFNNPVDLLRAMIYSYELK